MRRFISLATLFVCAVAWASDPEWILWPGESPYGESYGEINPSSVRKVRRDDYPTHTVFSILRRIHAPGKPYHNRPVQVLVDCMAQEFMYMSDGYAHKYVSIPLEAPEYALWDYLCNKS